MHIVSLFHVGSATSVLLLSYAYQYCKLDTFVLVLHNSGSIVESIYLLMEADKFLSLNSCRLTT